MLILYIFIDYFCKIKRLERENKALLDYVEDCEEKKQKMNEEIENYKSALNEKIKQKEFSENFSQTEYISR